MRSLAFCGLRFPRLGWPIKSALLPEIGENGLWLDPSDMSTLFQDTAGTTPVTAPGDPVALMLDKSGNLANATQATAGSRMLFEQSGRYLYLSGDGTADTFNVTMPDLGTAATVAYSTEAGVTILTAQTIGAGVYTLPFVNQLYGFVVIDRALTVAETAQLTAWFDANTLDFIKPAGDMTDGDDIIIPSGDMNTGRDLLIAA